MYLNTYDMQIPVFESEQDAKNWIGKFSGVRLWHATRVIDPDNILVNGLMMPTKENLDERLLSWIKNMPWYTSEVDFIIHEHPLVRGEPLAVYCALDKNDLSLNGIDHYKKYGSEYWQGIFGVLASKGYGAGRSELLHYGQSCIIGVDIRWESLDSSELGYIVESIFENDVHNTGIAVFRDISPNEVSSIELC